MPQWLDVSFHVFIFLVMLGGLMISALPIVPGTVVIWLAALVYGLVAGFGTLGAWLFAFLTLLTIASVLVDNVLMGAKAHEAGASWLSMGGALLAGVVGSFIFPPLGGVIAAPLVLYLLEVMRLKESSEAWEITKGLLTGFGLSSLVRFGMALVMVCMWGIWALWG
ncbi:MAG: DUF456 domain-containing protein [Chloroflexota bacterium]|nr:DUF456 domain-containing protein [Chloroflexota bacterium]